MKKIASSLFLILAMALTVMPMAVFAEASSNADLSSLVLSGAFYDTTPLTPEFNPSITEYTATVLPIVNGVAVTPTTSDANAVITVNGNHTDSGSASPGSISLGTGATLSTNVIEILVTAENGSTKTYTVTVTRDARGASDNSKISALAISEGTLTPAFNVDTMIYEATVPNDVTSVTVTLTVAHSKAIAKMFDGGGGFIDLVSGVASAPINLELGFNNIAMYVWAEDGSGYTYIVNVTRETPPCTVSFLDGKGGSVIETKIINQGNVITKPSSPVKQGYTFLSWCYDEAGKEKVWKFNDTVPSDITLYAKWKTNASSSVSGGSSGGGSGGGGGSRVTTPTTPPAGQNVTSTGAVDTTRITSELTQALKVTSTTGGQPVISVKNAVSITSDTIKAIAAEAAKFGKSAVVNADTTDASGNLQARLYVEPEKLAGLKTDLKLGVNTQGAKVGKTKTHFEKFFNNNISVISCEQIGSFGASLRLAAKVALPKDTSKLVFYSFDAKTNTFTPLQTAYTIDKNGYIHFMTELAGAIIISDKPLALK